MTLVGNKIDLENRQVRKDEAEDFARSLGLRYFEVSALKNIGIDDLFTEVAKALPKEAVNKRKSNLQLNQQKASEQAGACSSC